MSIEHYGSYYGDRNYEFAFRESKKTMSKKKNNFKKKKTIKKSDNVIDKLYIHGTFEVKFLSDFDSRVFSVGETINPKAALVNIVINQNVGDIFDVNGEKLKLLNKNLYYSKRGYNNQSSK